MKHGIVNGCRMLLSPEEIKKCRRLAGRATTVMTKQLSDYNIWPISR